MWLRRTSGVALLLFALQQAGVHWFVHPSSQTVGLRRFLAFVVFARGDPCPGVVVRFAESPQLLCQQLFKRGQVFRGRGFPNCLKGGLQCLLALPHQVCGVRG